MKRRELLKGLMSLSFLPLASMWPKAKGGVVARVPDMGMGCTIGVVNYTVQAQWAHSHCMVWDRESGTMEWIPLLGGKGGGGHHRENCICVNPVPGHELGPVDVTTEVRNGELRIVDVRRKA